MTNFVGSVCAKEENEQIFCNQKRKKFRSVRNEKETFEMTKVCTVPGEKPPNDILFICCRQQIIDEYLCADFVFVVGAMSPNDSGKSLAALALNNCIFGIVIF